jgi:hypothetical protein
MTDSQGKRGPSRATDNPTKTMLGAEQRDRPRRRGCSSTGPIPRLSSLRRRGTPPRKTPTAGVPTPPSEQRSSGMARTTASGTSRSSASTCTRTPMRTPMRTPRTGPPAAGRCSTPPPATGCPRVRAVRMPTGIPGGAGVEVRQYGYSVVTGGGGSTVSITFHARSSDGSAVFAAKTYEFTSVSL